MDRPAREPLLPLPLLRAVVFGNCALPGALVAVWAVRGDLGANPVDFVLHAAGTLALIFLLLTLSVTPLRRLSGWAVAGKFRRMLGLFSFFYACCHFAIYLVLDQGLSLSGVAQDVISRPFVTAGFAALAFMVPLAVTSTAGWVRRLGGARWQRLHRRVYGIAVLAVLHYLWLVKADRTLPLRYGAVLAALLGARAVWALRERQRAQARSRAERS